MHQRMRHFDAAGTDECPQVGGVELTETQVAEFREVFDLVDSDKGGDIDVDEVRMASSCLRGTCCR